MLNVGMVDLQGNARTGDCSALPGPVGYADEPSVRVARELTVVSGAERRTPGFGGPGHPGGSMRPEARERLG
jgi:hypothetical protein